MQPEQRLRRAADFAEVYRRGRSWANRFLVLKASPHTGIANRYGFAVGKRLGKAVVRNRIRRRLRAILQQISAGPGWDVVMVARGPAVDASFGELQRAVDELFRRARLVSPERPPEPPGVEQ